MNNLVNKILNSEPSLLGDEAVALIGAIIQSQQYTMFHSNMFGLDETIAVAEVFITALAKLDLIEIEPMNSYQPYHVVEYKIITDKGLHYYNKGLIYSNGAVIVSALDGILPIVYNVILFMDKDLAAEHGFESEKIKIDLNATTP